MRTNVVTDDDLMESALRASGTKTKKAAIEQGLKLLAKLKGQERIKGFRGKLRWPGNLYEMHFAGPNREPLRRSGTEHSPKFQISLVRLL
ncbi:MAG: type II toxin-antitoxin system VapB family antitoxin [Deltaproteobacteria bacterium]|nr:type II toxin-antitoxin system VapB family antitoxin [Deltaproteobacteria bacterium]